MNENTSSRFESFAQTLAVGFFSSIFGVYTSVKVMESDIESLKEATKNFQPIAIQIAQLSQKIEAEHVFIERQLVLNEKFNDRLRELELNAHK